MAKKPEVLTLKSYSRKVLRTIIILISLIVVLTGGVIAAIVLIPTKLLQLLVVEILLVAIIALLIYVIYIGKKLYNLFYTQGIEISTKNVQALSNFDKSFDYYEEDEYEELQILNQTFKDIARNVGGRTIISQGLANVDVPLKYDDEAKTLVNEGSLLKNMHSLIIASESYRNALIDISYNLGREIIEEKDMIRIYRVIKDSLAYERVLISFKENKQGFVIYVPAFDSLNQLKEELEYIIKNISLVKKGTTSKRVVLAHTSVVVYPYSTIDNLVKDLSKARKEKKLLNFYIPERAFEFNNKLLFSSMNINNTTKLIEDVASIDPDPKLYAANFARIKKCITNISNYYGFHSSGYIEYDKDEEIYINIFSHTEQEEPVFKEESRIDKKFVQALNSIKDTDSSYYFSNRTHINNRIASYIDQYRVRSGLFYVLTRNQKPFGILYFLNRNKDLSFDAYMKESLITSCHVLGGILKEIDARRIVNVVNKRFNEILRVSGINMYSVNKDTYELIRVSDSLTRLIPKLDMSLPCYKAIHGLNKPCKNCPLKHRKHMIADINEKKYEVYPILQNLSDQTSHLIIKPTKSDEAAQRFNDETLLSTFKAFNEDLSNQLVANIEGKILLLKIKNIKDIISKSKSDGFVQLIKDFADRVLEKHADAGDVYEFNNSTIALILHNKSDDDIITIAQEICELGKNVRVGDAYLSFIYLVKNYSGDSDIKDIQQSLLNGLEKYKEENEDEIVFIDTEYKRSASLDGYLLEQLLSAFGEKTYLMEFTPLLSNNTRLIFGAEIQPKIIDKNVDKEIDIAKAIKIAEERGFSDVYADGLLAYLDDMITRYTYTSFMSVGLSKFVLKVDHDFVDQRHFVDKVEEIITKHQLPKGFITFEASEEDVLLNEKDYKDIIKHLNNVGASFIVNEYEGNSLSIEQLSDMGVKEVKFTANLTTRINDQDSFEHITQIWLDAYKHQMKVNFTGIETRKVSEAIVFEGNDCGVQGSYFFKPLDEVKAFEVIRTRNMKDKDDLDN
jgi:EAL domain-containing protein (putative c-di-GMP-specific phosphodiesterase class I)/GGDEF domain-containing protein